MSDLRENCHHAQSGAKDMCLIMYNNNYIIDNDLRRRRMMIIFITIIITIRIPSLFLVCIFITSVLGTFSFFIKTTIIHYNYLFYLLFYRMKQIVLVTVPLNDLHSHWLFHTVFCSESSPLFYVYIVNGWNKMFVCSGAHK